jgi:CRP/FNR family cyclic AMP-dependent transcriptional regulator
MSVALDLFKDSKDYKTFAPGETIFEAGQSGDFMYVLVEGQVDIMVDDKVYDTLSPGGIFGEMALIDDSPRSATVRAKVYCKVVPLDQYTFTHYVQHSPFFALQVMSVMAERLRRKMNN